MAVMDIWGSTTKKKPNSTGQNLANSFKQPSKVEQAYNNVYNSSNAFGGQWSSNKPKPPNTVGSTVSDYISNVQTNKPSIELDSGGVSASNPNTGGPQNTSSSGGGSSTSLLDAYLERERARQEALQREQIASAGKSKDALLGSIADSYKLGENRLNQSLDSALSQAYISRMQAERAMPQQMSALGNTGGMTESALLGHNANYQTGRMGMQQNAADKLADLLAQRQQSETQAEQAYQDTVMGIRNNASNAIGNLESQYANNLATMQRKANDTTLSLDDAVKLKNAGYSGENIDNTIRKYAGDNYSYTDTSAEDSEYAKTLQRPAVQQWIMNASANIKGNPLFGTLPEEQQSQNLANAITMGIKQGMLTTAEAKALAKYYNLNVE